MYSPKQLWRGYQLASSKSSLVKGKCLWEGSNPGNPDILLWKAHVIRRSINQEEAKQDALRSPDDMSVILIMNWAMKFLQMRYREKQSDWFGKRGLSWHISTVITKNGNMGIWEYGNMGIWEYGNIFDSCQQDWYAVCSIIENTLEVVKKDSPPDYPSES